MSARFPGLLSHRLAALVLAVSSVACTPTLPTALPTAAVAVAPTRTATLAPPNIVTPGAATATETPTASPAPPSPTPTPCQSTTCMLPAPHAVLARPIGPGGVIYPDRTYPYGSTQGGLREPHHGIEFGNPAGTAVLSAADGVVVFAGVDTGAEFISPQPGFYGNVVVLEHALGLDLPVFTLYAHLRRIDVAVGQTIARDTQLGEVGQTGIAIGPHLHFEVRVGANTYAHTRNPELWLAPLRSRGQDWGALAGIVVDADGVRLRDVAIVIRAVDVDDSFSDKYLTTYGGLTNNGDDLLRENFAIGDLPPGVYRVGVNGVRTVIETVTVAPGLVTLVRFTIEPLPPTATPDPNASSTPDPNASPTPDLLASSTAEPNASPTAELLPTHTP